MINNCFKYLLSVRQSAQQTTFVKKTILVPPAIVCTSFGSISHCQEHYEVIPKTFFSTPPVGGNPPLGGS